MRLDKLPGDNSAQANYNSFIDLSVNSVNVRALIDTGASISCISQSLLYKLLSTSDDLQHEKLASSAFSNVTGVGGELHKIKGTVQLKVKIKNQIFIQDFHVLDELHQNLIIGMDFLKHFKAVIDMISQTLTLHINDQQVTTKLCEPPSVSSLLRTYQNCMLPAQSETLVPVRVNKKIWNQPMSCMLAEPTINLASKFSISAARCLIAVKEGKSVLRVINPTDASISLNKGTVIGKANTIMPACVSLLTTGESDNITPNSVQLNRCSSNEIPIDLEDSDLDSREKSSLTNFLKGYRDIFATKLSELGEVTKFEHTIETGNAPPTRQRFYRTTPAIKQEIERQINDLLDNDLIEESSSPWTSPVVMVKKKQPGVYRMAIDYRKLNSVTKATSFPLPRYDDLLDTIAANKAKYFSTLDMFSGYHQLKLDPKTSHKTSFITHVGQYQWKRLPFGLVGAPVAFQAAMTKILQGLNWKIVLVYIDDLLVMSENFETHLKHLSLVFERLREANIKLNPLKCKFAAQKVLYLGHIVSKHGVEVDPTKTQLIENFPTPKTVKHVRSFLGLANYYRKFVKDYAKKAAPLNQLLKKQVAFVWSDECEAAFQDLKKGLIQPPILSYPDFSQEFILITDASSKAISYILGQNIDGKENVIAYGGRALRKSELNYTISELECLSVVEGVKSYHQYLANSHFTIYTDHSALKYLMNIKISTGRLARWALILQGYNYTVIHRPGKINSAADAISRIEYPTDIDTESNHETDDLPHIFSIDSDITAYEPKLTASKQYTEIRFQYPGEYFPITATQATTSTQHTDMTDNVGDNMVAGVTVASHFPNLADMQQAQSDCSEIGPIWAYMTNGTLPEDDQLARKISIDSNQYGLKDNILYHVYQPRTKGVATAQERQIHQLVIPRKFRALIMSQYHDCIAGGAHQGFDRTYAHLRLKYYWPGMYRDLYQYVKTCQTCQQAKHDTHQRPAPLVPLPATGVFDSWHMDILGPLPMTPEGNKYVLLVVDRFSRWCEAFPIKDQQAVTVANILYKEIFARYGSPRVIVSDRGKNFLSTLVKSLCELFKVTRHHTSSYHPQTNASVERLNGSIAQALKAYCNEKQSNWSDCLPGILMAYRSTPATRSTQFIKDLDRG